jgi:hypothetical protein
MRQVQPETLPKNSIFFPVYKISSLKITPPKTISATYTRTKTHHKHRGICCLLSLVKTCLIHYSIILNLTTVFLKHSRNRKHYFGGWFSAVTFGKKTKSHIEIGQ